MDRGIIPAYAGSTYRGTATIRGPRGSSPHTRGARRLCGETHNRRADHPRIRGEHVVADTLLENLNGSSPHTRGARDPPHALSAPSGIIPAYAGSTHHPIPRVSLIKDHPRIRGEHLHHHEIISCSRGSSPHTRGALAFLGDFRFHLRIIPAYAGSTRINIRRR